MLVSKVAGFYDPPEFASPLRQGRKQTKKDMDIFSIDLQI